MPFFLGPIFPELCTAASARAGTAALVLLGGEPGAAEGHASGGSCPTTCLLPANQAPVLWVLHCQATSLAGPLRYPQLHF